MGTTMNTTMSKSALFAVLFVFALAAALVLPVRGQAGQQAAPVRGLPTFLPPLAAEYPTPEDGLLDLSEETPPKALFADAEIVVLNGRVPLNAEKRGTTARVLVDRPGRKVVLFLGSEEAVFWKVTATPETTLAAILVSARRESPCVTANVQVPAFLTKDGHATHAGGYFHRLDQLEDRYGIDRLHVFRADMVVPPEIVVKELDPPRTRPTPPGAPKPEAPDRNFTFTLLTHDVRGFQEETWTLVGPGPGTTLDPDQRVIVGPARRAQKQYHRDRHEALSPDKKRLYTAERGLLRIRDLPDGAERVVRLPASFPEPNGVGGLAFDSKRGLLVLTSAGGPGGLYRFDARTEQWLDFRQHGLLRSDALAYDATADRFVGIKDNELVFISGEGKPLFTKKPGRFENGTYRASLSILRVVPHGDDVALVDTDPLHEVVRAIWRYNLQTNRVTLTYYRPRPDEEKKAGRAASE